VDKFFFATTIGSFHLLNGNPLLLFNFMNHTNYSDPALRS
jgi:hypothetical protein